MRGDGEGLRRAAGVGGLSGTKLQIAEAALETLKSMGFAGASARAIAHQGDFNQALIFYHYGSVEALLLAALDASSAERLARYRSAIDEPCSLAELVERVSGLFEEDVAGGHVTEVTELLGGSLGNPALAAEVVQRMDPWLELTEQTFERLLGSSPLGQLAPLRDVSYAFVALYLGLNLLSRLDPAQERTERLFALLRHVAPLLVPDS